MTWFGGREAAARDKARRAGARRRAREKAAAPKRREMTLDELYARDNGYCCICKLHVPREQASKEHRVALSSGGTSQPSNLALAHRRCNSSKGARSGPKKKGLRRGLWKPKRKPRFELPDDVF